MPSDELRWKGAMLIAMGGAFTAGSRFGWSETVVAVASRRWPISNLTHAIAALSFAAIYFVLLGRARFKRSLTALAALAGVVGAQVVLGGACLAYRVQQGEDVGLGAVFLAQNVLVLVFVLQSIPPLRRMNAVKS